MKSKLTMLACQLGATVLLVNSLSRPPPLSLFPWPLNAALRASGDWPH